MRSEHPSNLHLNLTLYFLGPTSIGHILATHPILGGGQPILAPTKRDCFVTGAYGGLPLASQDQEVAK